MPATREHQVECHACGQHTRTITVADAKYWSKVAKMETVQAHGGFSSSKDTGKVRTASIGGQEFRFLEKEVEEHWPELARLFKKEDSSLI